MTEAEEGARTPGRVAGKVALITGAASGIGRAAAVVLAREGAAVALADVDEPGAARAAEEIVARGGTALSLRLDVTSEEDWRSAVDRVVASRGRLDVLVQSAGIAFDRPVEEMTLAEWRRVMAVDLDGVFLGTAAAIRAMRPAGRGSIVNISSASGIKASAGASAYCAAKAAVIMLSKTAALECANRGECIRVNALLPGGVKTPIWKATASWKELEKSGEWNATADTPSLKRFAEPEEIAQAIVFLASDESSYVTGAALSIDGGYTA